MRKFRWLLIPFRISVIVDLYLLSKDQHRFSIRLHPKPISLQHLIINERNLIKAIEL